MATPSFTVTLRNALRTFDKEQLRWAADGFAAECFADDPSALSELVALGEKTKVSDLDARLKWCAGRGPFDCFAMACLARHAGLGRDVTHRGVLHELPPAIAGDLTVEGPIVCTIENWLLVAGNVKAEALIEAADVVVAGSVEIRDGVFGINNCNQSMWIQGPLTTPVLITEDYSTEIGAVQGEELALSNERVDALLEEGLAEQIRGWQDEGPDGVIGNLLSHVTERLPVFRRSTA